MNAALRAFYALQHMWDVGGDLGMPDGFVASTPGGKYVAVRLELWTEDCLMDCKVRDARRARMRGEALAARWLHQGWARTGYTPVDDPDILGVTWAYDVATQEEINAAKDRDAIVET
jgi:hypothetical protein